MTFAQSRPFLRLFSAISLLSVAPAMAQPTPPPAPSAAPPAAPTPPAASAPEKPAEPPTPPAPTEPPKAAPPKAVPAPPTEPKKLDEAKKAEAAHRFDRGLQLFEGGDNAGALAEFKRTYEIFPNFVVLYNIGLVYAAMGRPVDAVDALEPVVTSGALGAKQLERAKQTLADQRARVGRLSVSTKPEGARIEVDNVEVAHTPLTTPLRIAEGSHIVGAVAEGFAPARKEIVIAGNSDASLALELIPMQGKQLANLAVRTGTAGADVLVDGESVGKTPLATSVTLVAGHHVVEVRRPGYVPVRREVDVGAGATGDLAFDLAVDPSALGVDGATFVLESSETPAELTIDGVRQGPYRTPLRLPRGPHHLSVSAAGFIPLERDVVLDGAQTNVVHVVLEPTPETRKSYESSAHFHRTWGWVGVISGAAIAGAGSALALIASSQKSDAQRDVDAIEAKYDASEPPCDYRNDFGAEASQPRGQMGSYLCNKTRSDAHDKVNAANTRRTIGFIGVGVGAGVAITGVVLLLTGNDPDKYERAEPSRLGRARPPKLSLVPGPGEIGTGLRLTF